MNEKVNCLEFEGRQRAIQWTEKFRERPLLEQVAYMEKLANAMNDAADALQKERNSLLDDVALHKKTISGLEKQLEIQKQVVRTISEQFNKR